MAFSGVQGHKLEINVVGCNQLKDTWYGRHKPYVALLYGTSSHQTKPSRDGGKNPSFNEKFEFSLIEGIHELSINVFSSHNILDSFIGHGKVNLEKVFREGYSATLVPLESLTGKLGKSTSYCTIIQSQMYISNKEQTMASIHSSLCKQDHRHILLITGISHPMCHQFHCILLNGGHKRPMHLKVHHHIHLNTRGKSHKDQQHIHHNTGRKSRRDQQHIHLNTRRKSHKDHHHILSTSKLLLSHVRSNPVTQNKIYIMQRCG